MNKVGDRVSSVSMEAAKREGIGWVNAAVFLIADLVGGGVVAIPVAFLTTGLVIGITEMLIVCALLAYSGYLLGINWLIMQQRWPQYKQHCRRPYAEMALRSGGHSMKVLATTIIYVTLFGVAVVYVLLSAQIFSHFLEALLNVRLSFCYLLCAVTIAIMPLMYLKSPANFWIVGATSTLTTILAIVFIAVGITLDVRSCGAEARYPAISPLNVLFSVGTFVFAFSGHTAFPTIQHDMRRPKDFTKSIVVSFAAMALMYMPLSVYGYLVYGDNMVDSVIDSMQTAWVREAANLAIAIHCVLTLVIVLNPLNQHTENFFNASHSFGVERVAIRSGLMFAVLACALTLPNFGSFMNLVGSTTIPFESAILPIVFNLYLTAATHEPNSRKYITPNVTLVLRRTSKKKLALNAFIIVTSVVAGVVSAYLAIVDITHVNITYPCYVRPFLGLETIVNESTTLRTCGLQSNTSTLAQLSL